MERRQHRTRQVGRGGIPKSGFGNLESLVAATVCLAELRYEDNRSNPIIITQPYGGQRSIASMGENLGKKTRPFRRNRLNTASSHPQKSILPQSMFP
ncbi:hypothetical protein GX48_05866 [Paracoccidioides brasiliensis]|nr:hypothetical protein GX48_05866 [Paracoccidioides brasiliensis]